VLHNGEIQEQSQKGTRYMKCYTQNRKTGLAFEEKLMSEFNLELGKSSVGFMPGTQGQELNITMMWEYSKAG